MLAIVPALAIASGLQAGERSVRMRTTIEGVPAGFDEVYAWTETTKVVDGERQRTILRWDRGTVTTLDKRTRTYRTARLDDVRRDVERMTQLMARPLRRLPRAMRDGMGQAGFDPRPRFTLRPSGRRETVAGYATYELVLEGGPVRGAIWVAPDLRRTASDRTWAPFTERLGTMQIEGSKLASALARLPGWPARMSLVASGGERVHVEMIQVRDAVDPALLVVPEGYGPAPIGGPSGAPSRMP